MREWAVLVGRLCDQFQLTPSHHLWVAGSSCLSNPCSSLKALGPYFSFPYRLIKLETNGPGTLFYEQRFALFYILIAISQ